VSVGRPSTRGGGKRGDPIVPNRKERDLGGAGPPAPRSFSAVFRRRAPSKLRPSPLRIRGRMSSRRPQKGNFTKGKKKVCPGSCSRKKKRSSKKRRPCMRTPSRECRGRTAVPSKKRHLLPGAGIARVTIGRKALRRASRAESLRGRGGEMTASYEGSGGGTLGGTYLGGVRQSRASPRHRQGNSSQGL